MKILAKVGNIFDHLNVFGAIFVGVTLILLMLSITYAVAVRYTVGWTVRGAFEWWEYSLIFVTFMGAAWVLRREGHVSMDIVIIHLKPNLQAMINRSTSLLGLITCLFLTGYGVWATWLDLQTERHLVAEFNILRFPLLMTIPIGSLLLSVEFLRRTFRYFGGRKMPSERTPVAR